MNKMTTLLLSALASLLVAQTASAGVRPEACPSAEAIKKAKFSIIFYNEDEEFYMVGATGKFETTQKWGFLMGIPGDQATGLEDALNKANAALATVSGTPKPVSASRRIWRCKYMSSFDYPVVALTPIGESNNNNMMMNKAALTQ